MRAGMIRPFSLMKSLRMSMALYPTNAIFSAVKRHNLRRRNSARCPRSFLSLPLPLNFPLPRLGGGISVPFHEFDVRHVQHRLFRLPAPGAQKSLALQRPPQRARREQPRLGFERDRVDFGTHLAVGAGLGAFRLV